MASKFLLLYLSERIFFSMLNAYIITCINILTLTQPLLLVQFIRVPQISNEHRSFNIQHTKGRYDRSIQSWRMAFPGNTSSIHSESQYETQSHRHFKNDYNVPTRSPTSDKFISSLSVAMLILFFLILRSSASPFLNPSVSTFNMCWTYLIAFNFW